MPVATTSARAGLCAAEIRDLGDVAGTMVPADATLGIPGADDPAVLDEIVKSVGRDLPLIRDALRAIAQKSAGGFAGMDRDRREALINDYHASGATPIVALGRLILSAYYRDDRVLQSLGQEARAPFPKGYTLEQGDWTLLDAVRKRPPLWRDDRKELAK